MKKNNVKLNIIDFIIILFFLLLVCFFVYKFVSKEENTLEYADAYIGFCTPSVYDFVVKNTYVGDKVTDSISNIDIGNLEKIDITLDPGNGYYAVKLSVHAKAVKAEHGAIIGGKIYNVGQINKLYVGYGYYEVSVCELAFK